MLNLFRSAARPAPLSIQDAIQKVAGKEITLIDVREHGECAASGIAQGALHIPLATLRMKADPRSPECHPELKSGKPIAIYCAAGGRAGMAAQTLEQMGHAEVHNIGGFGHWAAAGGPVQRL